MPRTRSQSATASSPVGRGHDDRPVDRVARLEHDRRHAVRAVLARPRRRGRRARRRCVVGSAIARSTSVGSKPAARDDLGVHVGHVRLARRRRRTRGRPSRTSGRARRCRARAGSARRPASGRSRTTTAAPTGGACPSTRFTSSSEKNRHVMSSPHLRAHVADPDATSGRRTGTSGRRTTAAVPPRRAP